ncbi:cytochrome C biogenesis protein CcdA [Brevibacillus sp. NSP2.1]|uniref:cytochrome c biogenesis CcdA family protein n=2 Tax=Paenibacillaceae TaxID=186822 RepID=UPI000686CE54|nr:cytochrome c biogenesis protein CcdA [Brevibacillus sp. NSP2.1]QHZ54485.1 cytochrome C biogenesis protein CcdA [Brevibacillus sp. NSP2.1]
MFHTLFFITGFSIVFVALGLSTSLLGSLFSDYQELVRQIGGILLVLLGLIMVGFFKTEMLMKSWKIEVKNRPLGYFGSVIVGVTYAAGWTPCVGPILSSIIVLGVTNPTNAIYYTLAYTLGFAIPFFLMTFFISKINAIAKYSERFMKIGGAFMILFGILLYTNKMTDITVFLIRLYGGFTGF